MDAIETKALALVNEVRSERGLHTMCRIDRKDLVDEEALCRAIEQHEAFRQKVSDAVHRHWGDMPCEFDRFIITKPDPLVEALTDCLGRQSGQGEADDLRAAIAARGGKITFSGDDGHD